MKQRKKATDTCLFCSKKFRTYKDLEKHMVVHTEESPFDCQVCGNAYRRIHNLNEHQAKCHPELKRNLPLCNNIGKENTTKCRLSERRKTNEEVKTDGKDGKQEEKKIAVKDDTIQSQASEVPALAPSAQSPLSIRMVNGKFKCGGCLGTFSRLANLKKHIKLKRCKGHGKESRNGSLVKVATTPPLPEPEVCIPGKEVRCDNCSRTFSSRGALSKHKRLKRCKGSQEIAEKDSQVVKPVAVLAVRRHPTLEFKFKVKIPNRQGYLVCKKCNLEFGSYSSLRRHIRANGCEATGIKCDICQATFASSVYLSLHKQAAKCSVSPSIKKMENLAVKVKSPKQHKAGTQRKSGFPAEKPMVKKVSNFSMSRSTPKARCTKCSSVFISRGFLKKHCVEYHDMKLWNCKLCPDWYCRLDGLKRHMRQHHKRSLDLAYRCILCGRRFDTLDGLKGHGKYHTKKNYECDICHYTYARANSLREHSKKTGHGTDGDDIENLPKTPDKAPDQGKKSTPERKSKRVIKPVTPYSPSLSPVVARKKVCSLSPDITDPKFYYTPTTANKPQSDKQLESKSKPEQRKSDKRSKSKSNSRSLLRPPVFQYNKDQSFSPLVPECPKMEVLTSPVTTPSQVRVKNLRRNIFNHFQEHQQQQSKKQSKTWDDSFFLHLNRYVPDSD